MQSINQQLLRRLTLTILFPAFVLFGTLVAIEQPRPTPARAAGPADDLPYGDITRLQPAHIPLQQNIACDGTETGVCNDGTCTHVEDEELACIFRQGLATWYGPDGPPATTAPEPETATTVEGAAALPGATNLVSNGNFEFGFYQVPELGFEPPDIGNVPKDWGWYKNQAYGKYKIDNNQRLGLVCADDSRPAAVAEETSPFFGPIPGVSSRQPNNALELHMQSTDQQDARLGVYQTINVTPGQVYQFSMSTTLQIQSGGGTLQPDDPDAPIEAQNHTIELYFDHTGNTNWRAIPHKQWTIIPFDEQKLEFKVSEDDEDISVIEDYYTFIQAQSNKMTIFLTFWRKWANWRTGIASIDCVSLIPVNPASVQVPVFAQPTPVPEGYGAEGAEPAAMVQSGQTQARPETTAPPQAPPIIPPAGGVLKQASSILTIIASIIIIAGLVGAGIWNMRK